MTKILQLPDELMQQLEAEALSVNMTAEDWALLKLQQKVDGALPEDKTALTEEEFERLSNGVVNDYREVLERLA
jgi:hypothetical protein